MSVAAFSPQTARLVFFERDQQRCFLCQAPLRWQDRGTAWSLHHRKPRGMGSSKDPALGSAANALTLCGTGVDRCHGYVESHRRESMEKGWLISVNSAEAPEDVPVMTVRRTRVLLTVDGRIEEGNRG